MAPRLMIGMSELAESLFKPSSLVLANVYADLQRKIRHSAMRMDKTRTATRAA